MRFRQKDVDNHEGTDNFSPSRVTGDTNKMKNEIVYQMKNNNNNNNKSIDTNNYTVKTVSYPYLSDYGITLKVEVVTGLAQVLEISDRIKSKYPYREGKRAVKAFVTDGTGNEVKTWDL
jgi:hypothetical protein